jgi:hypothetical protein
LHLFQMLGALGQDQRRVASADGFEDVRHNSLCPRSICHQGASAATGTGALPPIAAPPRRRCAVGGTQPSSLGRRAGDRVAAYERFTSSRLYRPTTSAGTLGRPAAHQPNGRGDEEQ